MKWLPKSLSARLEFLIVGTALLLFAISFIFYIWFPLNAYKRLDADILVKRLGSVVSILETLTPEQGQLFLQQLYFPAINITLAPEPGMPYIKGSTPTNLLAKRGFKVFIDSLKQELGDQYAIESTIFSLSNDALIARQQFIVYQNGDASLIEALLEVNKIPVESSTPVVYAQIHLHNGSWLMLDYIYPPAHQFLLQTFFIALATILFIFASIIILTTDWIMQPLRKFSAHARQLSENIDVKPLPVHGPSEIQTATQAINDMQKKLKHFIDNRVMQLAAISHDLQTPLTRMRLDIENIAEPSIKESLQDDIKELMMMIQATLNFSEALSQHEESEKTDLMSLLQIMQEEAENHGQHVTLSGDLYTPVLIKPISMKRCLQNLIDNAVRYGGHAEITVEENSEHVIIKVTDTGPGIPENKLEQVLEPFYRLESSRNRKTGGTGLGLSIAKQIAISHGGQLTLKNNQPSGLIVTLTLPK